MQNFLIYCVGFFTLLGTAGQVSAGLIYSVGYAGTTLVTIDSSSGATEEIGEFGVSNSFGMAFDPHGTLYITSNKDSGSELYTVNTSTGKADFAYQLPTGSFFTAIDFDAEGLLYGLNEIGELYTFDLTVNTSTKVGETGVKGVRDLSFDSSGNLYGVVEEGEDYQSHLYRFKLEDELVDGKVPLDNWVLDWGEGHYGGLAGLMFDENAFFGTTYVWGDQANSLFEIDITVPGTATVTSIGYTIYGPSGGDFGPSGLAPVPEPGSLALFGVGAATMALTGAWRRRRRGSDVA